jgi:orotidine-5'-phosphate decarboxylase
VDCGVDGIVSSPHEAALAREIAGPGLPGGDPRRAPLLVGQERPGPRRHPEADALKAGASHLVCGRPITAANDPREAALKVVAEMPLKSSTHL